MSRRGFLGATGVVGSAALAGTLPWVSGAAAQAAGSLPAEEEAMVLQLARAGATLPFSFPAFGERGAAASRATPARLEAAARRLPVERSALARAGAVQLIEAGLLDVGREGLLSGIGHAAAEAHRRSETDEENQGQEPAPGQPEAGKALVAVVALAVATVSRHFDPASDHPADVWIGGLRRLAERGERPQAVRHLEAR